MESEPGQGTIFRIYLPAAFGLPEVHDPATMEQVQGGMETILVAEDHEALGELVHRTRASHAYRVILANDGQEAVRLFKAHSEEIQLVVLDVVMPRLTGLDTYSQMRAVKPDLPVIFTTGHAADQLHLDSVIKKGAILLEKPYTLQALNQAVRSVLDRKNIS